MRGLTRYGPYPHLEDSGDGWLGKLPGHWSSRKLKFVADSFASNVDKKTKRGETPIELCNYTDVYYNDEIMPCMPFMSASATKEQIAKFTLCAGDTLITKDSEGPDDIAIPSFVPQDIPGVVCGYHLAIIRPGAAISPGFLSKNFQCSFARAYFSTRANGLTRYGLGGKALGSVVLPIPPLDEQTQITKFLDYETAKIDALIEKQQQLIALLQEKRQAVISHAVTKGLNPDAPMRDSGVEWLGEVPAHWSPSRAGRLCTVISKGTTPTQGFGGSEVPFVRVNNLTFDGTLSFADLVFITLPTHRIELGRSKVYPGDVLMNIVGPPLGKVSVVGNDYEEYNINQAVAFFRVHDVEAQFLTFWLQASFAQDWFWLRAKKTSGQANLTLEHCRNLPVAVPPRPEQREIVATLGQRVAKLERTLDLVAEQLNILRERRTALISAAVTGKIDVRNWKPPKSAIEAPGDSR